VDRAKLGEGKKENKNEKIVRLFRKGKGETKEQKENGISCCCWNMYIVHSIYEHSMYFITNFVEYLRE
jgi:hypothetical protein